MKKILVPTRSTDDWRLLLAQPDRHWSAGHSALALAQSWESAQGDFPTEVRQVLDQAADPVVANLDLVLAVPEYTVALPGGSRASQTDLLVVARNDLGVVVLGVEGKVDESFGPTLGAKRADASPGQTARLDFLHRELGLDAPAPDATRYQLLHRAVSVLLVARQFHARAAILLVHSFSPTATSFGDFATFGALCSAVVRREGIVRAERVASPPLFLGWCTGDAKFAAPIAGS